MVSDKDIFLILAIKHQKENNFSIEEISSSMGLDEVDVFHVLNNKYNIKLNTNNHLLELITQ